MKLYHYLIVLFYASFVCACQDKHMITLVNSSDISLHDYPIIIDRSSFEGDTHSLPLIRNTSGEAVSSQLLDQNNDGDWDQVVFQYTFQPLEEITLNYERVGLDELPVFKSRTQVYLGHSPERNGKFRPVEEHERPKNHLPQSTPYLYQYEGPGWESELVGFRSYFDRRNGKDIFGKTRPQLNVNSIGLDEDYHSLQEWGMDVLKVGSSLGAGALAILKDDSLYRLGKTDMARFRIISNGPVTSVFQLVYDGWEVDGTSYGLEETITIWGGKRWFESEVKLTGGNPNDTLVTGIVNLKNVPKAELISAGWNVLYSHGKQSENNDFLGMSILTSDAYFIGYREAPEGTEGVTNTYTVHLKPKDGIYKYVFYAGWEGENQSFGKEEYFRQELISLTRELNNTIEVKFGQ